MKVTLTAVKQEISDFKNEVLADLKEIKIETKKTNGRVNKHDISINLMEQTQDDCPARNYHKNMSKKDWIRTTIPAALSAILTAGIMHFIG